MSKVNGRPLLQGVVATAQVVMSFTFSFFVWWLYNQPPVILFGASLSLKGAVDPILTVIGLDPTKGWGLMLGGDHIVAVIAGIAAWCFWMISAWPFYRASGKQPGGP